MSHHQPSPAEHLASARLRWPALGLLLTLCLVPAAGRARCPEPPETDQGGRKGLARRNFIKSLRHEIGLAGGVYASDVMGAAPLAGINYTFHIDESFALEARFGMTWLSSKVRRPVERVSGYRVLADHSARIYSGNLVWHPIHGKFMLFRTLIPHFDIYLTAGAGVTDSRTAKGLTYSFGAGIKIFTTSWLSLRLDLRDQITVQELLGSDAVTNNLVLSLGVGFWLPLDSS